MRIGLDISPLTRPYPDGVVRACGGLFEALQEHTSLEVVPFSPAQGESERAWRHLRLPGQIAKANLFGFHSPISAFPARGPGKRVSTVHELPWRQAVRENAGPGHRFWAQYGVARGDRVLCPTDFVRSQLIEECGVGERTVVCVPWGVGALRTTHPDDSAYTLQRLQLSEVPYALALGATRPKKNLKGILAALARLNQNTGHPALHLVITGPSSPSLQADLAVARELGVESRVHYLGQVSEEDLSILQGAARMSLVLGHSEGFGFPTLEAMQQGTPVVVSRLSAQAEIAGTVGLQANPCSASSMADAMASALSCNGRDAEQSRERARHFGWQRAAQSVEELWRGLR
jgi:glycosyltransferase involved in cell wall biosynthesis